MLNFNFFQYNYMQILPIIYAMIAYTIIFSEQTKIPQVQLMTIFFIFHYYFKTFFNNKLLSNEIISNNKEQEKVQKNEETKDDKIMPTEINNSSSVIHPKSDMIFQTVADIINEINSAASGNPKNETIKDLPEASKAGNFKEINTLESKNDVIAMKQSKWFCCSSWSWCGAIG
jgi:hypothetical protein